MIGDSACIGKPIVQCNYITNMCTPQIVPTDRTSLTTPTQHMPTSAEVQTRESIITTHNTDASSPAETTAHTIGSSKVLNEERSSADFSTIKEITTANSADPVHVTTADDSARSVPTVGKPNSSTGQDTNGKITAVEAETVGSASKIHVSTGMGATGHAITTGPTDSASSASATAELKSVSGHDSPAEVTDTAVNGRTTTGSTNMDAKSNHIITGPTDSATKAPATVEPKSVTGQDVTDTVPKTDANGRATTVSVGSSRGEGKITSTETDKTQDSTVSTSKTPQTNGNHSTQSRNGTSNPRRCWMKTIQVCENQPSQTPTPAKKNFWANAEKEIQSLRSPPIVCGPMDFSWKDWKKTDCQTSHIVIGLTATAVVLISFALLVLSDIFQFCMKNSIAPLQNMELK